MGRTRSVRSETQSLKFLCSKHTQFKAKGLVSLIAFLIVAAPLPFEVMFQPPGSYFMVTLESSVLLLSSWGYEAIHHFLSLPFISLLAL